MSEILTEAYLLIEVPEFGRTHVYKYKIKHDVTKIGSESGINQVVIHDDSIAAQHMEIIYAQGEFFLRRVAEAAVNLDKRFMEVPSEKLSHGAVIEVDKVRLTFLSGYAGMSTAVFFRMWTHESGGKVPFITALLAPRRFCLGLANCDMLLNDETLKNVSLEFENFGPNAITVRPTGKVNGMFLNDAGLTARARLIPGDSIILSNYTINIDFLAASILGEHNALLSEEAIARYRMLPL